ncbi:MAG: WbqC family protein [Actinobacteria bacterium]|nr:WbqC family protein [Actinomycetota bacterium]
MRVAVMQPYFYPYLGYFELLAAVDRFVVYGSAQYRKGGWVNRNRIRSPHGGGGWQYLTVPVEQAALDTPIDAIRVNHRIHWGDRQCRTLGNVFGSAAQQHPAYLAFTANVAERHERLAPYLRRGLDDCCRLLGIEVDLVDAGDLEVDPRLRGEDRLLALCEAAGAATYVNLPGGRDLYSAARFASRGMALEFVGDLSFTGADGTVNDRSILDVLLGDGLEAARAYLRSRR